MESAPPRPHGLSGDAGAPKETQVLLPAKGRRRASQADSRRVVSS